MILPIFIVTRPMSQTGVGLNTRLDSENVELRLYITNIPPFHRITAPFEAEKTKKVEPNESDTPRSDSSEVERNR